MVHFEESPLETLSVFTDFEDALITDREERVRDVFDVKRSRVLREQSLADNQASTYTKVIA